MATNTLPATYTTDDPMLRLAAAAHLARYKGESRAHRLRPRLLLALVFEQGVMPLQAQRGHVELYLRWLQEVRRLKPSTVSRRLSVLATFYRTCVVYGVLEHSPAEYVRRPHVPPESPTLGLSHPQFEAMLSAGRDSANPNDFALVAMLGLLGLRIFEATGSDVTALGEARGHRVLKVLSKGDKTALVPLSRPRWVEPWTVRCADEPTARYCSTVPAGAWTVTPPLADSATWRGPPASRRLACTHTCFVTPS